jgi:choline kinase
MIYVSVWHVKKGRRLIDNAKIDNATPSDDDAPCTLQGRETTRWIPPVEHAATTVTTAVILAAGCGSRLRPATDAVPKCLSEVNGVPILEQQVRCLRHSGFHRLVMVVGHFERQIRDFLDRTATGLTIDYVVNPRYRTTNNIYSLWLAQEEISEPFLLLECDLFFKESSLRDMLEPNKVAVSRVQPWMKGTTVDIDADRRVTEFKVGHQTQNFGLKTVNIYSFSAATWDDMRRRLEQRIRAGAVDDYYEVVLAEMVSGGDRSFGAVDFPARDWHEIDTLDDLHAAQRAVTTPEWDMSGRPRQRAVAVTDG